MNDSSKPPEVPKQSGVPQPEDSPMQSVIMSPAELFDPPVLAPRLREPNTGSSESFRWIEAKLGSESYGAPRVFDLFTMLAITLAFAILFGGLRLCEPLLKDNLPNLAITIGSFVTLTAIAQIALWQGEQPRLASIVSGPFICVLLAVGSGTVLPSHLYDWATFMGMGCLGIVGFPIGYLGGALVAGVFLLADIFRQRFISSGTGAGLPNDDEIWK